MFVLSRVSRLTRHLDLERRRAFVSHGLRSWEFGVLSSPRRLGAPYTLTPRILIGELFASSGTMTSRIDRPELKGFVSRSPSPEDRRVALASLSDKERTRVDSALTTFLECERTTLGPLDIETRQQFATQLMRILAPFDRTHSCT